MTLKNYFYTEKSSQRYKNGADFKRTCDIITDRAHRKKNSHRQLFFTLTAVKSAQSGKRDDECKLKLIKISEQKYQKMIKSMCERQN